MKQLFEKHKRGVGYLMVLLCFIAVGIFTKAGQESFGAWSILPPVMLFLFAIMTKSVIEGFIWGGLLATFMNARAGTFTAYLDGISETIQNGDNVYLILIFLFIGIFIAFLKKSGAAGYFANWLGSKTNNPKYLLIIDWVLGIGLSVDEYMSGFTVGAAMTPVNDKRKIPREMTAYVIRSVNVPPACMNPLNAWAIFIATTLESIGFAAQGHGMTEYIKVIPFLFFNIIAMLVSFLTIIGALPKLGGIKKAYERVEIDEAVLGNDEDNSENNETIEVKKGVNLLSFIVPIVSLVAAAIFFNFNMVYGIMAATIVMVIIYLVQRIISISEVIDIALMGISDLVELTVFLIVGMNMASMVSKIGFTEYVVSSIQGFMTPWILPFIVFVVFAFTEYFVTFNWTLYLLALPSVIGLAQALGTNVYLAIAALVCAGVWGSSASFSADNGIVVSSACKIKLFEQNMSQLVYMIISAVLSAIAFLVAGIIMTV
ncbi:MAG: Na+/H+ antiporter NhaC family protein [Herbinix sp.]|nr:Na+/H+ antiporter NhaC family protein [Herbinix sp.]